MTIKPVLSDGRFDVYIGEQDKYDVYDREICGYLPAYWGSPQEALEGARQWVKESEELAKKIVILDDGL